MNGERLSPPFQEDVRPSRAERAQHPHERKGENVSFV